jgi:hypothetical protein
MNKTQLYTSLILEKMNLKTWMRLRRSIIHVFYNLVVIFLLFQTRKNELFLVHIYVKMLEIPKSYLNIFLLYTYLILR